MTKTLLWIGLLLGAIMWLMPRAGAPPALAPIAPPGPTPETPAAPDPAGNGFVSTTLTRAPDGHFYAEAQVNGATLRLMVDTGATSVALTRADAQAAGIQAAPGDFTLDGQGAGGMLRLKRVTLDRVAIGPVAARKVDAVVAEAGLPVSLIGQSFLGRVGHIAIDGDRMVLR